MVKLVDEDFPELFRCFLCLKYWPMKELKEVGIQGFLFKKQVCTECFGKVQSGYSGGVVAKENSKERGSDPDKKRDSY